MRFILLFLISLFVLPGCASRLPSLTEDYRRKTGEQDLQSITFHVSNAVEFRSVRGLDSVMDGKSFQRMARRLLAVTNETPGHVAALGKDWVSVDFGKGIVLTFVCRARDSVYATAGWGTISIDGERYDILVGLMSGADIELKIRQ
jgi:hypothetical protein